MDVRLPNGTVIRGVPDGISKEEVRQKAIANGFAKEGDFPPAQQQPWQQDLSVPTPPGFEHHQRPLMQPQQPQFTQPDLSKPQATQPLEPTLEERLTGRQPPQPVQPQPQTQAPLSPEEQHQQGMQHAKEIVRGSYQSGAPDTSMTAGEVTSALARRAGRGLLSTFDLPGDIAHLVGEGERHLLSLAEKYLPGVVSSAMRTASEATAFGGPVLPAPPPPGHFREKIAPPEKDVPILGPTTELAASIVGPGKAISHTRKVAKALIQGKPEVDAATQLARKIEQSSKAKGTSPATYSPDEIRKATSIEDVRNISGAEAGWREARYPTMTRYGVYESESAKKTAGEIYDRLDNPYYEGMGVELDVTKGFGNKVEQLLAGVGKLDVPPAIRKLITPGKGPYTVNDMYVAMRAINGKLDTTNNAKLAQRLNQIKNELKQLETVGGAPSRALEDIREANALYTEAKRLDDVEEAITGAAQAGKAYKEGLVKGTPQLRADELLARFDDIGDEKMFDILGERYYTVREALRKLGQKDLDAEAFAKLGRYSQLFKTIRQAAGGLMGDWRLLSVLFPGQIVGTAPYHAAKALRAMSK